MSARISKHLIRRLQHEAGMQAIAAAIDVGLLAAAPGAGDADPDQGDAAGKGSSGSRYDTRFSIDVEDDVIGAQRPTIAHGSRRSLRLGPLLAGRSPVIAAQILRRRAGVDMGTDGSLDETAIVDAILAAGKRPRAVDLACMMLIAAAIRVAGIGDAQVLSALSAPQPVICIHGAVPGFEKMFVRLLDRGLLSHGRVKILRAADEPRYALHGQTGDGDPPLFVLCGSTIDDEDDAPVDRLVSRLSRHGLPILCVSERRETIPSTLRIAASLDLVTGPLTPTIVTAVIDHVLGNADWDGDIAPDPDDIFWRDRAEAMLEPDCALLTLSDLALAIRPRIGRDRTLEILVGQGRLRRSMETGKEGTQSSSTSSGSSSSYGWQGRHRNGDAGTGCEIVQPVVPGPASTSTAPTIETMHGYGRAKSWALDLKADLDLWRQGRLPWDQMSTKLLLSGPPGTGKTTYAKALCNSLGVPLVLASVSTWLEPGYLGDVIKRIRQTFEEAAKLKPAMLFVDELDGIGSRGASRTHDDYWRSLINKLLELLDGALRSQGVIVVGATNEPGHIDPALRRSGRLETHIEIPLPDVDALVGIIAHHLGDDRAGVIASRPKADKDEGAATGDHVEDDDRRTHRLSERNVR